MEFLRRQIFPRTEKIAPETMTTQFWGQECRMITYSADPRMPNRQWGITQFTSLNSQKSPALEENQEGMKAVGSAAQSHMLLLPRVLLCTPPRTPGALSFEGHTKASGWRTPDAGEQSFHQSGRIDAQQPPPSPLLPGSQDTGNQALTYLPTYRDSERRNQQKNSRKFPELWLSDWKGSKSTPKKWIKYTSWKTSMGNSLTLVKKKRLSMLLQRKKKQLTYTGSVIRKALDSSRATLKPERQWSNIFKILNDDYLQPRVLHKE